MVWIRQRWHVEVTERERHLWPDKWIISGHYEDEHEDYKKAKKEWDKKYYEGWSKEWADKSLVEQMNCGEDYFHWNVESPGWSLWKNGTWNKSLIDWNDRPKETRDYPGVYNSYEEALITLGKSHSLPPKYEGYAKHLNDFVESYKY